MPKYNKLVRDRIPHIIESNGKSCRSRILNDGEYADELRIKLREEAEEYFRARNDQEALEELADLIEVIEALARLHGASPEQLEAIRVDKAAERGGFADRVYLIDVED